jgi:hypothetical protein
MTCVMENRGACYGRIDPHHIIPKVRLKLSLGREKGIEAAQDARNMVPVCRYHHTRLSVRATKLREDEVPDRVWEAAADWGMQWSLEKDLDPPQTWESQDEPKGRLGYGG